MSLGFFYIKRENSCSTTVTCVTESVNHTYQPAFGPVNVYLKFQNINNSIVIFSGTE